jgi:DNA-binding ferritin-like protein/transcriptional regulator with XRE-family HTH domain
MRFGDIGQQLRAYRIESGLRADEIAAQLGVSRAALYRYEKGEVIKLDTIARMAELLKISPMSLLGMGVEYYHRPVGYFERLRQLEETADQILQVEAPLCYLTTSHDYDEAMAEALGEAADQAGPDRAPRRAALEQVQGILATRRHSYAARKPAIICIFSAARIATFLDGGVAPGAAVGERTRRRCAEVARAEVERMAELAESEPMGLQFGLLAQGETNGAFTLLRARDRASLANNPFRPDAAPWSSPGVAMITGAEEAVAAHQRVAETLWREALKGSTAAAHARAAAACPQCRGLRSSQKAAHQPACAHSRRGGLCAATRSSQETPAMAKASQHPAPAALATRSNFGDNAVRDIAAALNGLLADVFALYLKTKNFHWHMSGPHFRDFHLMLDEQSDQILEATDELAERVRKVGGLTLHSIGEIARTQRVRDNDAPYVEPQDMLAELQEDNTDLAKRMREAHATCDDHGDVASASLLENFIDEAERRAWFLYEASHRAPH